MSNQMPQGHENTALPPKILIIEDEPKIAQLLIDYLVASNFNTVWVSHGKDAYEKFQEEQPDLVLLDLMLPGRDGLDICKDIRRASHVPVIMLTARIDEIDRLLGLEIGADDYICKPFSPREVVARVRALLRRASFTTTLSPTQTGELLINIDRFEAQWKGVALELTPAEFRLLHTLASVPGKVFPRDQLINQVYDDHRVVTDRTIDSHIKNLRRKLEAVAAEDIIRSVYGVGYKLEI